MSLAEKPQHNAQTVVFVQLVFLFSRVDAEQKACKEFASRLNKREVYLGVKGAPPVPLMTGCSKGFGESIVAS